MSNFPKSVLFVCTGNTCRSPMAQGIFQQMLAEKGLGDVKCDSAGISAFDGEAASENSIEAMNEIGIDISAHRSKTVTRDLLESTDVIVCISRGHYEILRNFIDEGKLRLLGKGVSDPYGMCLSEYIRARDEIKSALYGLFEEFSLEITQMNENHISGVAMLEKECFGECAWSENSLKESLQTDGANFFVALYEGEVAGYVGMNTVLDEGYITNVAVGSQFRRKGIADKLITRLDECMKEKNLSFISLEVRVSNTPAISLYEKNGYKNVGKRKNFYRLPTEDAYIMTKERGIENEDTCD